MKPILFVTLAVLAVGSAGALNVDEAVSQALSHNLGQAGEDLKVAQKADEKNFSVNRLYPTLSTSATLLRLNADSNSLVNGIFKALSATHTAPPAYTEDQHWMLGTNLTVQFLWNLAVFRGMTQTLIDYQNAVLSREAASARLARDVRKTFYQLLALRQATGVFENQLKVADDRYRLSKANADAGLGSEIAALQAQVAFENRKPVLADQKLNEANALSGFRLLLNLPDDAPLVLEGSLDIDPSVRQALAALDPDVLVKRYLDGRWDVGTAQGTVRSLANLAQLQADSLWPSFILGYTADPGVAAPLASKTWEDANSANRWVQSNGALTMTLAWKLDGLLPGSTTGIEIAGRQRQAEQARLAAEQIRRAGENEIRTLVGRLKKSAVSLEGLSLALDLAQRSAKLTEAGYQAGTQSFNEAQDADLQLQTARLQFLNEELALQSALADLDYALAADRKEWLHG
jgi:outer membrane protein TolC